MTVADLDAAIRSVCPILGVDSAGNISFDPSATPSQQTAAQNVVAANVTKVNGQPSRLPLDPLAIYNTIKTGGTAGLTQGQQLAIAMACSAVVMAQNPALAARINQALNLTIPYDQANPQG